MIIPYRSKNPPEHAPSVTIGLIVINVLIYLLTSYENMFLRITESNLQAYAVSHDNLNLLRLTSAMFLHGDIMHILGNMLFLWIFGAAAEGRLRPFRFLIMYFISGWTGGLLSDLVLGSNHPDTFSLGASGAIMGVAGAYLYMFPFSKISIIYVLPLGYFMRFGRAQWQALYVVLLFVGLDLLSAFVFKSRDGVGHFAHIGGFGSGFLLTLVMRARRDTSEVSEIQALRDDVKDYSLLDYFELEALLQQPTEKMELVLAFCEKAVAYRGPEHHQKAAAFIKHYATHLFSEADPNRLAAIMLTLQPTEISVPPVLYLRIGSRLESIGSNSLALQIYRRVYDIAPNAADTEMALYRTALIMQNTFRDFSHAQAAYNEMLRLFPQGEMSLAARRALQQIGG